MNQKILTKKITSKIFVDSSFTYKLYMIMYISITP